MPDVGFRGVFVRLRRPRGADASAADRYGPIGNRVESVADGQVTETLNYCANNLNQYATLALDDCPPTAAVFTYGCDEDGTTYDRTLVWDAENRLVEYRPTAASPPAGAKKYTYTYDYRGRRGAHSAADCNLDDAPARTAAGDW